MLRIDVRHPATDSGPGPVVMVAGEVDLATAPQLRQTIRDLLAEDSSRRIRVDLAEVSMLDSTGVFVLVDGYKQATARGGTLIVENPQRIVRRVLEICGLLDLLVTPGSP